MNTRTGFEDSLLALEKTLDLIISHEFISVHGLPYDVVHNIMRHIIRGNIPGLLEKQALGNMPYALALTANSPIEEKAFFSTFHTLHLQCIESSSSPEWITQKLSDSMKHLVIVDFVQSDLLQELLASKGTSLISFSLTLDSVEEAPETTCLLMDESQESLRLLEINYATTGLGSLYWHVPNLTALHLMMVREVDNDALLAVLASSGPRLRHLYLEHLLHESICDGTLYWVPLLCSNVTCIRLADVGECTSDGLCDLAIAFGKKLKLFEFSGFFINDFEYLRIITACKQLRHVSATEKNLDATLALSTLENISGTLCSLRLPSLQRLLSFNFEQIAYSLPNVSAISIHATYDFNDNGLWKSACEMLSPKLHKLHIHGLPSNEMLHAISGLTCLKEFSATMDGFERFNIDQPLTREAPKSAALESMLQGICGTLKKFSWRVNILYEGSDQGRMFSPPPVFLSALQMAKILFSKCKNLELVHIEKLDVPSVIRAEYNNIFQFMRRCGTTVILDTPMPYVLREPCLCGKEKKMCPTC